MAKKQTETKELDTKVPVKDKSQKILDQKTQELEALEGVWFAVHSYAGHENRVASALQARIRTQEVEDFIYEVLIPTERGEITRGGKTKEVEKVRIPGYILVRMVGNDEEGWDRAWSTVRQTPGVTGFVGQADQPISLTIPEVLEMLKPSLLQSLGEEVRKEDHATPSKHDEMFTENEPVKVIGGPFEGNEATVSSVDPIRHRVIVMVSIFGRETPVDLDYSQVEKLAV